MSGVRVFKCPNDNEEFKTSAMYREHWYESHPGRPPRLEHAADDGVVDASSSEEGPGLCMIPLNVLDLLMEWESCTREEASAIYSRVFKKPPICNSGFIYHRRNLNTGEFMPLTQREHAPTLKALFAAELSRKRKRASVVPPVKAVASVDTASGNQEVEQPQAKNPRSRYEAEIRETDISNKLMSGRFESIRMGIKLMKETLHQIQGLNVDDETKDMLRDMAVRALRGTAHGEHVQPPIVMSRMVQEYLGYAPVTVYNNGESVNELYKKIGRAVRERYISMHGSPPGQSVYSDNGVTKKINKYASADKGWIAEIVKIECTQAGCVPRPRVLIARGEQPAQS